MMTMIVFILSRVFIRHDNIMSKYILDKDHFYNHLKFTNISKIITKKHPFKLRRVVWCGAVLHSVVNRVLSARTGRCH